MLKTVRSPEQAQRRREVKKLATRMVASMSLSEAAKTAQEYASAPLFVAEERELWRQVGQEIEREWGLKAAVCRISL